MVCKTRCHFIERRTQLFKFGAGFYFNPILKILCSYPPGCLPELFNRNQTPPDLAETKKQHYQKSQDDQKQKNLFKIAYWGHDISFRFALHQDPINIKIGMHKYSPITCQVFVAFLRPGKTPR